MVVGWVFSLTEWWLAGYLVVSSCRDVGFLVVLGLVLFVGGTAQRELNKLIRIGFSFNILLG